MKSKYSDYRCKNDKIYDNPEDGVKLVWTAFDDMLGGEIYIEKSQ